MITNILYRKISYFIHSLLFLSKWGETYCYSLTHALRSGISILYSDIGAFSERIPKTEHHFPITPYQHTRSIRFQTIMEAFYQQLNYIITNSPMQQISSDNNSVSIPNLYKSLII